MRLCIRVFVLSGSIALASAAPIAAQTDARIQSKSAGFFLGGGFEGDGITDNSDNSTESGSGVSLIMGYGFSKRLALFGAISGAVINLSDGSGTYSLGHADLGVRWHFRTGPNRVVPFLEAAATARAASADVSGTTNTGSGPGVSFGGGLNAHFTPAVALSTALTWTVGRFDRFQVGSTQVNAGSVSATSARIHLGIIWFAQ